MHNSFKIGIEENIYTRLLLETAKDGLAFLVRSAGSFSIESGSWALMPENSGSVGKGDDASGSAVSHKRSKTKQPNA